MRSSSASEDDGASVSAAVVPVGSPGQRRKTATAPSLPMLPTKKDTTSDDTVPGPSPSQRQGSKGKSEGGDGSVHGGNMFAGLFNKQRADTASGTRRRTNDSSNSLDETRRRGYTRGSFPAMATAANNANNKATIDSPSRSVRVNGAAAAARSTTGVAAVTAVPPPVATNALATSLGAALQIAKDGEGPIKSHPSRDVETEAITKEDESAVEGRAEPLTASGNHSTLQPHGTAIKKVFTKYHNSAITSEDATSAYLGDDPSSNTEHFTRVNNMVLGLKDSSAGERLRHTLAESLERTGSRARARTHAYTHTPLHHSLRCACVNFQQAGSRSTHRLSDQGPGPLRVDSVQYGMSRHRQQHQHQHQDGSMLSRSVPSVLETVREDGWQPSFRVLRPIQGPDEWKPGRRYLVGPASLATCPLQAFSLLSGGAPGFKVDDSAPTSPTGEGPSGAPNLDGSSWNSVTGGAHDVPAVDLPSGEQGVFGTVILGLASLTYVGEMGSHLPSGWSKCFLAIRQNYLLEYSDDDPGILPRGFAHLGGATAAPHPMYPNTAVLEFFGRPCSKTDRREVSTNGAGALLERVGPIDGLIDGRMDGDKSQKNNSRHVKIV